MLTFLKFTKLVNIFENTLLTEAVSQNTKGVMHELLVGYHLNGGKHMDKHEDIDGLSPQEAHDKLKSTMTDDEYKVLHDRAKSAAEDIKKQVGGNIHKVSWTSKPGDLKRATGIEASQKEDASDLVVTTRDTSHPSGFKHHGVSLKVTDNKQSAGEVPVSNPGLESTYGGKEILDNHRKSLLAAHPAIAQQGNKEARKQFIKSNPKIQTDLKKRNTKVLNDIASNLHEKLSSMKPRDLADHIRNHVLHAHQTPMQKLGHNHIRHTTYGGDGTFSSTDPSKSHEHILTSPQHISVEKRGTSIIFSHKGVPFARHRLKFESQSDPLSSIKGSGEIIKSKAKK